MAHRGRRVHVAWVSQNIFGSFDQKELGSQSRKSSDPTQRREIESRSPPALGGYTNAKANMVGLWKIIIFYPSIRARVVGRIVLRGLIGLSTTRNQDLTTRDA